MPCHGPVVAWVLVAAKLVYGLGVTGTSDARPERVNPGRVDEHARTLKALVRALGDDLAAEVLFGAATLEDALEDAGTRAPTAAEDSDDNTDAHVAPAAPVTASGPPAEHATPPDPRLAHVLPAWQAWRERRSRLAASDSDNHPRVPWSVRYAQPQIWSARRATRGPRQGETARRCGEGADAGGRRRPCVPARDRPVSWICSQTAACTISWRLRQRPSSPTPWCLLVRRQRRTGTRDVAFQGGDCVH